MHTKHACVVITCAVICTLAHERIANRCIHLVYKFLKLFACSGENHSASYKYIWLFGCFYEFNCIINVTVCNCFCLTLRKLDFLLGVLYQICRNILWNIHKYRTRSAFSCYIESSAYCICKLLYILYNKAVFGYRRCNSGNIYLLKAVLSK